ncbi:MAG TPA: hypothetical protein VH275_07265 [Solirubrobacterales bacterium]|nr:hypothetical protein [Solirubrobacterales bacterium]
MTLSRKLTSTYARIGRTCWSKAPSLLLLAIVVFIPVGFLDALTTGVDVNSLDIDNGLQIAAVVGATAAIAMTGLLGEVFYSGAVAVSLTHPEHEKAPPIAEVARRLDYRRLILVDIVYVAFVIVGLLLFFVPGILVFVWFGLSGPVVEIEGRTVRGALRRSAALVRHNFWLVFLVLAPVELAGDAVAELIGRLVHGLLGDSFFATWMAESLANIVFTPIFAVAAVLLTLDLIATRDSTETGLPTPQAVPA